MRELRESTMTDRLAVRLPSLLHVINTHPPRFLFFLINLFKMSKLSNIFLFPYFRISSEEGIENSARARNELTEQDNMINVIKCNESHLSDILDKLDIISSDFSLIQHKYS